METEKLQKDIEEIKKSVKKIERYLFWKSFWSWLKTGFLILIIILGYLYLPKFLNQIKESFSKNLPLFQENDFLRLLEKEKIK